MFKSIPWSKVTLKQNLSLAWPMTCNAILMQSVAIIDLLLIASLGELPIAAFGIAAAIVTFILGIQFAISNGTQLVLSRAAGAGDKEKIATEMVSAWLINLSFSCLSVVALFFSAEFIVSLITDNPEVIKQATQYILISLVLLVLASASVVMVSYFNANKKTRIPLYGFMIEIPLNVVFSVILINGYLGAPALGLAGAALGSVMAIALRFSYLAIRFYMENKQGLVGSLNLPKRQDIKNHLNEVVPVVANFIVLLTGLLIFQILFAQLSVPAYAAITLILPWIKIGSMFANTWAQASTILVSQYVGKKEFASIPDFVYQSLWVTRLIAVFIALGFFALSLSFSFLYPNLSEETLMALSIIAPIYIILPLVRTNNMFCGNMIRAMGDSYLIVRINIITQWLIALPLCALLIYWDAPLYVVFGVILFDEILKCYPFRKTLQKRLDSYLN
ncbi:MATE family efflux transporter [Marinomonas sp. C2222]|uniref:MATE family efflux transporter n=1 Tax=Marinomonas sargassi TaxID=2984494 RepID=A0ABT2YTH0_9GAMM|nr:MATE family efflux transporter [Marinomonas sargassi]MCV2403192.1 MATE family efflux transporter [Marinomonas sargassi]